MFKNTKIKVVKIAIKFPIQLSTKIAKHLSESSHEYCKTSFAISKKFTIKISCKNFIFRNPFEVFIKVFFHINDLQLNKSNKSGFWMRDTLVPSFVMFDLLTTRCFNFWSQNCNPFPLSQFNFALSSLTFQSLSVMMGNVHMSSIYEDIK